MLEAIGLNADLAQAIADWIDADDEALPVAGAEDDYYLRLPRRIAANQPVVELSELLRVRGMDEASSHACAAGASAAHAGERNLAPPELLFVMVPGLTPEARALASTRVQSPFRSLEEFEKRLPRRSLKWIEGTLSVGSSLRGPGPGDRRQGGRAHGGAAAAGARRDARRALAAHAMTTCRIRVTRATPVSGAFEWVTIGKQGEILASGSIIRRRRVRAR